MNHGNADNDMVLWTENMSNGGSIGGDISTQRHAMNIDLMNRSQTNINQAHFNSQSYVSGCSVMNTSGAG